MASVPIAASLLRRPSFRKFAWILALSAAAATPVATGAATDSAPAAPQAGVRYRVIVDAPSSISETVANGVDLIRWQNYADMTRDLLDRLIAESIEQARETAAAEGYFSAAVKVGLGEATADDDGRLIVRMTVDPGEPTRVTAMQLKVTGPAASDVPDGTAAIAKAESEWLLPVGSIFRQAAWEAAKQRAVATVAASAFAGAKLARSEARIDPETRAAVLAVEIASGPAFRVGAIDVRGLAKYDAELVRHFSTLAPGDAYSEARLDQFVRRLTIAGYFSSVQARIEPDPAAADAATIAVSVIEAPPKRLEGGISYSTDTQIRGSFRYSDMNFDHRALQMSVEGGADVKVQNLSLRFVRPPTADGHLDAFGAKIERTDIEGLETRTGVLGVRRQTLDERDHTAYGVAFYEDDQHPDGAPAQRSRALYFDFARTWRIVDDLIDPTRGYVLNAQLGAAPPGVSTRSFGRAIAKFAAWVPLDPASSIEFRAEAGAVIAPSRNGIPSVLLFRTGGDTTVRGYAFDSLGVQQGDATVGGRYYALASIEAVRWFTESWGLAAFVDTGNANDDLAQFRPVYGYGAGLRVKSPIGPFRMDVAYGQETQQVRVHLSVGLSF
jgi:translocation and assembly module TamA